ncbi:hypothetical protein OS188_10180 [Xanthomarina sp. F1114]|uniref:hypothetical protein n=1 Tax=Xanthomarina sp. F1114 TaxID=2996019 RepID=UPI00225E3241|nr:hypothetical protein [Xanthomarina sp. F1114]MCX7548318.1 hypothetical protein [Xanthomarina sp. F1114]
MKTLKLFVVCLLFLSICSCSKDDDSNEDDIKQQVENFVTPELIQTLQELGFNFNDGEDTPNIEGRFYYDPNELAASNVPNDNPIGSVFISLEVEFSELKPEQRQFTLKTKEGTNSQSEAVTNTFYSGIGNKFSAYAKLDVSTEGGVITILYAFSGTIMENGITNAQEALIMLDDNGVDGVIENTQGRLFKDSDDLAERQ